MKKIASMLLTDWRNIYRDSLLAIFPFIVLIAALAFRFLIPLLNFWLLKQLRFDLSPYYPLLMSMVLLMAPIIIGTLIGFMMLDERDEGMIAAFQVTPFGKQGYLIYRLLLPTVVAFVLSLVGLHIAGLTAVGYPAVLFPAFLSALEAPIVAMFLPAFATSKVEGLAVSKTLGIFELAPFGAAFLPETVRGWMGFLPPFWVADFYLRPDFSLFIAMMALCVHLVWIAVSGYFFLRRTD